MPLSLVTAPVTFPISLGDVRRQTKTEGLTSDDLLIVDVIIPAVVDRAQNATDRQFLTATWSIGMDSFPGCSRIEIPKAPLVPGSVEISYRDAGDVVQTWAGSNYVVDAPQGPHCARGGVQLTYQNYWPTTYSRLNAVTVTFQAGYGADASSVPALLRAGMLMDAASLYRQRENILTGQAAAAIELPRGSTSIYRSFRSRGRC